MAELLDYALETGKVTAEQLLRARDARVKLKQAGVRKTLEEAAILYGVLTREQHATIAQELLSYRGIQAPEPQVAFVRQEEDDECAARWRGQGRREEVDLGIKRQTELRLAGFAIPLWEILQGLGLGLEVAAPESLKPSPPPAPAPTAVPAVKPAPKAVAKPVPKVPIPPRPVPAAKPPAPPMSLQKKLTIGLSAAGGAVILGVVAFVVFYDPSAPPPVTPPSVAVKPPEVVKPPETLPPPVPETPAAPVPEAAELYALEDRINALGLVSVVHLLRKKESEAKALTAEMEKVRKLLSEKMTAVVAAGRSVPLGHRLHDQDEILAVQDKPLWNDPQQLIGTARWLEDEVLRGLKAGQPVNVVLNRQGRRLEFTLQFHSDPSWPESK